MLGGALGPYRLDRELGSGGMGKVWAATVEGPVQGLAEGTRVALKVVHPHLLETPGYFERFLREAEIGMSVAHENVVRTIECDQLVVGGVNYSFLVMEYVEGQTLRDLLVELERVPEELCRHIGREVAKGLAAIHAAGVFHRDMKPENVLITRDHQVKVMDLGVARLQDEALRLSQTGAFVGSIHYAAPECFREGGRNVDGRADLHALGLVLYELASGVNPYFADDIPQVLRRVLHEDPRRLGDLNPQLSPFFEEVVHTLLAKDPGERFADATALHAVLEDGETSEWWRTRSKAIRAETDRPLRRIRIPRETAVFGREAELAKLRALFEKAKAGEGQVVLIEGEAGIGKSRLVDELIGRLQRDGEDMSFLFGSYPPGGAATAAGALSTAFREQIGDAGVGTYVAQTPLLVPAFEALLRGDAAPSGCEALTTDSIATCFVQSLRALAAQRPTVLLVDDLHFATDDARALFTSLALAVAGHRILLVGTTRPGNDGKWLAGLTRLPQTSQLAVQRLGPKDLIALLRDSFRSDALAAELAAQIATKSDGNPFFALEIIRGLREGQFITQKDDGTWVSTRVIDEIRIPSSVRDLVNARVADLTEEERALLDVAACWGFEFDPALVGDVLGLARIPALRSFGQVERLHRLVRSSGRSYVFDHHQVQEALYGSLHELMREEYHAALAAALEARTRAAGKDPTTCDGALCVDLCEHYLMGARGESALRYLDAALAHLEKGYLNDAAIRLTDRVLAVPGLVAGSERAEILLRRAERLGLAGRSEAARAAIEEARTLADAHGEPLLRSRAARALGELLTRTARYAEAESALGAAVELARAAGDRRAEARATGSLGNVFRLLGRPSESRAHHERDLALSREAGDRQGEVRAAGNLGNVFASTGRFAEAREHHERHLAIVREIGHRQGEAVSMGNLGVALLSLGRFSEAREHLGRALELSRQIGDRPGEARATGNLGLVLQSLGRLAEAQEHIERHLALCREIGDRQGEARATGNLGVVCHSLGRFGRAREHAERHAALARDMGDRQGEARATGNLGSALLALGRPAEARSHHERFLALTREVGNRRNEGFALHGLSTVSDEEGDADTALRLAEESLALRREIGHSDGVAESLGQVGDLQRRRGESDAARRALEESLRLSREQGRAAAVVRALVRLACLPGGDAKTAEEALAAARADADSAELRLLLWQTTGDRAHLAEAKRMLDESLAMVPAEHHAAMLTNVRVNREIAAAAQAAGL